MHGQETCWGQVSFACYKDTDGNWLDGGVNYGLHVPANAPAEVMRILPLEEAWLQAAFAKARPNGPCPCGGGKKFKHCPGRTSRG